MILTTSSNRKDKDALFKGLNKAKGVNVLDAITEFSVNTDKYLKPEQIDSIVEHLNNEDYITIIRKYLTKVKKANSK